MKPIFSKTTEKFFLVAKLSDDKLKLFVDIEPVSQPAPEAAPQPSETPQEQPPPNPPPEAESSQAPNETQQTTPLRTAAKPALQPEKPKPEPKPQVIYQKITRDDLLAVLSEIIKPELVNMGVIDDIAERLSAGEKTEERRIAKGEEPQPGADGRILFLVKKFTGEGEITANEKGYVDFHQLRLFDNITKGMVVARVYPPKNGVDGVDALGKPIPSKPGKPFKVSLERNLVLKNSDKPEEQFQIVVSDAEGYLLDDHGKLSIKNELFVNGDLDYHVGAIDFIGSVRIKGDVLPGFSIKAKTGIQVDGSVREANLTCPQGNISIKGHIYGGKGSHLVCGRDFFCTVAQELDAEVAGNISVEKEALDCSLRSQGALFMDKGNLLGGKSLTVCGAQVKNIGLDVGKRTYIVLCSDVEMTAEYTQLIRSLESHEKAITLINLHLGPLASNPDRIQLLAGAYREKMEKLHHKKRDIETSRAKLIDKRDEMLRAAHTNKIMRVNVLGEMYEGTEVRVGTEAFAPGETLTGPLSVDYNPELKQFSTGDLKPLECTVRNQGLEEQKAP